jgi:hypothetical protein
MEIGFNGARVRVFTDGTIETYRDFKFVNSLYTRCNPAFMTEEGQVDVDGYVKVSINNKYYKAHAIVAMAYLGVTDYQHQLIRHINLDKTDNRVENLQIV